MAEAGGDSSAGGGPTLISKKTFFDWKHKSTVRQIQKKYEAMSEDAKRKRHGVDVEMRSRGYKDFAQFNESCPQFPLGCHPNDLAELGSGYVLYFHFLKFAGILMAVAVLFQLPALYIYSNENWLLGWQWSTWSSSYSPEDPCKCIGTNDGIDGLEGPFPPADNYGTSCKAWDAPYMFGIYVQATANDYPVESPGKWACRPWCFASSSCPTRYNSDHPSMTDVHWHGLVRSYSQCEGADSTTEASIDSDCAGYLSADVQFSEAPADLGSPFGIGSHWLTVGNFGPGQADLEFIPLLYFVLLCVICALILLEVQRMLIVDHKVDADTTLPHDFAIMVHGLPQTATDERAILQWFRENSLPGQDTEIVKVVIGWNVEEFRDYLRELKDLSLQLKRADATSDEAAEIKKRMEAITEALNSAAPDKSSRLQSSGIVIVNFRYQRDMRACLNRWNSFWGLWFYSDSNGCCKGSQLPMFPIGDKPACRIRVSRAANPGDINWEDLGVDSSTRYWRLAQSNGVMCLLILATIAITYFVSLVQNRFKNMEETTENQILTLIPAVIVAIMNAALKIAARRLAIREYHDTKSEEEGSQTLKMSAAMIVTTTGVLLFPYLEPKAWYQAGGLVNNAGMMLFVNSVFPTLFPLIQFKYMMRYKDRRKLTKAKINHMNEVIQRGQPKDATQMKEYKQVMQEIEFWKRTAFAPEEMDRPRRLADVLKTTVVCLFFSPMIPWIPLVGVLGCFMQYWVDKYMLLRKYMRSDKPANRSMALFSMRFLKLVLPLLFSTATWLFLTPSFEDKAETLSLFFLALIVSASFSLVIPMSVWAKCLLKCKGGLGIQESELDYYGAQHMWSKEMKYHKDQFLYKMLPEAKNPEHLKLGSDAAVRTDDLRANFGSAAQGMADAAGAGHGVVLRGGLVTQRTSSSSAVDTPSSTAAVGAAAGGWAGGSGGSGGGAPPATVIGVPSGGKAPQQQEVVADVGDPASPQAPSAAASSASTVASTAGGAATAAAAVPSAHGAGGAGPPAAATTTPVVTLPGSLGDPAEEPSAARGDDKDDANAGYVWEYKWEDDWHAFADDCQKFIDSRHRRYKEDSSKEFITVNTRGIQVTVNFQKMTTKKKGSPDIREVRRRHR
mmetsp:Transcript_74252/g.192905  ORF Transcript_74252/g.192905 Transcript_74252/m.192905 type:complete len:1125 (-) Transcript_74252:15-3389(-)